MFELFKGLQVDWLGKRKLFIAISMLLLLIGMVSLVLKGRFEYGTDFKGGTVVVVKFNETVDIGKVRDLLPQADIQTVQSSEGGSEFQIGLAKAVETEDESVGSEAVTTALNKAFAGKFRIESSESVSAKVGSDLRRQAVTATLYALAGILIYIAFRFEWIYGAAAVFAVFHDTLITLGFFSLFNYEINLTVIAALLTLVGYSVNDTIVIFDRVRENLKVRRKDDLEVILNDSINQTFSRTILTSALTFLTVIALFLFGGEIINNFAFAMVIGIIVGSYSSFAIAAPLVLIYSNLRKPKVAVNRR
ncbi:MAG TPA: protein translocase subunit SecF [Terriglobia bacterium]|jgi:preprotein translocase subunit SecF|nr:protein translocase subunit SecF [Terriglobia bacterium]HVQ63184.1 protein translocase subunit SecF [Terriglobia bacterium]